MPRRDKYDNPIYPKTPYYNEKEQTPTRLDFSKANLEVGSYIDTASLNSIKDLKRFYTDTFGTPKQVAANEKYRERHNLGTYFDPYGMSNQDRAEFNLIDEAHRERFQKDYFNFYPPTFESSTTKVAKPAVPEMKAGGLMKSNIKKYNLGGLADKFAETGVGKFVKSEGAGIGSAAVNVAQDYMEYSQLNKAAFKDVENTDYYTETGFDIDKMTTSDSDMHSLEHEVVADRYKVDEKTIKNLAKQARKEKGEAIGGTAGTIVGSAFGMPGVGQKVGKFFGKLLGGIRGKKYKRKIQKRIDAEYAKAEEDKKEYLGKRSNLFEKRDLGLIRGQRMEDKKEQVSNMQSYLDSLQGSISYLKYGGTFDGVVKGPSHEEGGVMATKNGKPVAEIEGEEYVTNAKITKNSPESKNTYSVQGTPLQILSALNSVNNYGDATHPGGKINRIA